APFLKPVVVKAGAPVSSDALVPQPAAIKGLRSWSVQTYPRPNSRLRISGNGVMATVHGTDQIAIWTKDGVLDRILMGHNQPITSMDASAGGTLVASSDDERIRLWDVATGTCLADINPIGHGINRVAFAPDGKRLLVRGGVSTNVWGNYIVDLSDG